MRQLMLGIRLKIDLSDSTCSLQVLEFSFLSGHAKNTVPVEPGPTAPKSGTQPTQPTIYDAMSYKNVDC